MIDRTKPLTEQSMQDLRVFIAEDQQSPDGITQLDVDTLLALLRHHDAPGAHALVTRMWTALQTVQRAQREADLCEAWIAAVQWAFERPASEAEIARAAEYARGAVVSVEQRELQEWAIDVVFDGPPGPEAGRFVEVEDVSGKSVGVGQWIDRGNGMWALRIPRVHPAQREADLREAFLAGGPDEDAAAEYTRSKAGA